MPKVGVLLKGLLMRAEEEEARLQAQLADIRIEIQGLRLAIRRALGDDALPESDAGESRQPETPEGVPPAPATSESPATAGPQVTPAVGQNWTELVAGVLGTATEPLGAPDVLERLTAQGIEATSDQVRGGLAYLKRRGRAYLRKRGQWVLFGSPADQAMKADEIFRDVTDAPEASEPPAATGGSEVEDFEGGEAETSTNDPVHT